MQDTRHHGVRLLRDGSARFSLWAPDATRVQVELADGARHDLRREAQGWFSAELDCPAGTLYHYWIDERLRVPDPASRSQQGDVAGASQVVDPAAYRWQTADWQGRPWHEAVFCELHVGLLGGFAGVATHLPALAEMGITAIELMPLGEFPGARNWGYDGVLPFAPEASYGSPADLQRLVDQAHGLGLMVFVDVVYNHFGPEGNYLHQYASAFFREDQHTPWGAAIDFRRPQVRDFFIENALMWLLDYRIDGLRLDAVHAIPDQDFLIELARRVRAAVPAGREIHLVVENEGNSVDLLENGYTAQWNDDAHNVLHALLTREREGYYADFCDGCTEKLARCLGEGFVFQGQADRRGHRRGQPSGHLPPTAFVLFLQNHDQVGNRALGERLVSLAAPQALEVAVALQLLCPMIPLLFMGEERGCSQPFLFFTDYHDELGRAVREGRQREFAAFSAFAGIQVPDPNAPETFERSRPQGGAGQWQAFYRHLLQVRHRTLVPRLRGSRAEGVQILQDSALTVAWRLGDGSRLRIDFNLGERAASAAPLPAGAQPLYDLRVGVVQISRQLTLPPGSLLATLENPHE
ncbi:MAG TPA: malto-oligosyltrehalose trehalohydrolase [Pseudomonas sp.]|uniref:malto-oligosyltrehalose trehalohydrolase n=1 Tax=Pseudomonas sp. TaxID=306 RepID=UPI002CA9651F|nr:malto-oligosyltrehalose trehalohydrolase [Pseudomonas sp.]HTO20514.1 malto-oligosyltrehalose trehalohydrolase [Pseudomonas sp.]